MRISITLLLMAWAVARSTAAGISPADNEFFESKIRPLLAERCYECHSVENGKAKGGLTLDTRAGWQKGGQSGTPIVPGKPEESLLVKAVKHSDPDLEMPPKGGKLADAQIADLEEWINIGAPDPREDSPSSKLSGLTDEARRHYAFQPIRKPAVPQVKRVDRVSTPIDAFVVRKLEDSGLLPNDPATRQTLIRRAYFDMIGLPPSPAEVIAFVQDTSPNAWEKVVEHLIDSPHHGERWARHWLDTARYSDTTGGERRLRDDYRYASAWTYRDYVIRALNDDTPYDRFIVEQLAADRLPAGNGGAPRTSLAALGFLTVGQRFQNPNDIINDRIDAVCKGFLGLTVTCARCHDHKFDPVSQADYYALHGVFASTVEPGERPLLEEVGGPEYDDYLKKKTAIEARNRAAYYRAASQQLTQFCRNAGPLMLMLNELTGRRGGRLDPQKRAEIIRGNKLDPDLVRRSVQMMRGNRLAENNRVFWPLRAFAALPKSDFAAAAARLVAGVTSASPRQPVNPLVAKAFVGATPASMDDVAAIYGRLFSESESSVAAFIEACKNSTDGILSGVDADTAALLRSVSGIKPANALDTVSLRESIARWQPRDVYRAGFVFGELNELDLTHPGAPARAMAVEDAATPRNSPIFIRGQAELKGEAVPRRFLEVLGGGARPFIDGSGRLELAKSIADPQNPLTARVAVNRIWMNHFGAGLVPTADDLGVQSEPPSHPELLDWLAATFIEGGWSMKNLHRLILLSAVYQQGSETNPAGEKIDPQNRLLWRANIRRLDFEGVRDSLLVLSGRLDATMFGQPVNITDEPYSYRRSVYGYVDRGNLPDLMQAFDFSDPDMPNSQRATTVVPQQALFLMNSPFAVDVARKVVERPEFTAARDDVGRIRALYEVLFQRWPKPQEIQLAQEFVRRAGKSGADSPADSLASEPVDPRSLSREERRRLMRQGMANRMRQNIERRRGDRRPIQNEGDRVDREPLDPWEQFAQTLLFTNELAYLN